MVDRACCEKLGGISSVNLILFILLHEWNHDEEQLVRITVAM